MRTSRTTWLTVALLALTLGPALAWAQDRPRDRYRGGDRPSARQSDRRPAATPRRTPSRREATPQRASRPRDAYRPPARASTRQRERASRAYREDYGQRARDTRRADRREAYRDVRRDRYRRTPTYRSTYRPVRYPSFDGRYHRDRYRYSHHRAPVFRSGYRYGYYDGYRDYRDYRDYRRRSSRVSVSLGYDVYRSYGYGHHAGPYLGYDARYRRHYEPLVVNRYYTPYGHTPPTHPYSARRYHRYPRTYGYFGASYARPYYPHDRHLGGLYLGGCLRFTF